ADFLWKNFPYRLTEQSATERVLRLYKEILLARAQVLSQVQATLATKGFALSLARLLSLLIWGGWRQHVDQSGFGPAILQVLETRSLPEARRSARESWQEQGQIG